MSIYLLTFLIVLGLVVVISLIVYCIKQLFKPKGEKFQIKKGFQKFINNLKHLNRQKVKKYILGTNFNQGMLSKVVTYVLLISIGFVYLYPVIYMLSNSFKSLSDIVNPSVSWVPTELYLGNFERAFRVLNYFNVLLSSLPVTLIPAIFQTLICSLIGYGFARFNFKFKKTILVLVILTFIIPAQVYMIPKYVLFYEMKLLDTPFAIILPAITGQGLNSAIFILIFYQFFKMIPNSLFEAAEIDGSGPYRTFFTIGIPLAIPSYIISFLFSFVWYWNETYLLGLFAPSHQNLQIKLSYFVSEYTEMFKNDELLKLNEGVRLAATFLILLPMLIVYFIMQRWFVEGIERSGIAGE